MFNRFTRSSLQFFRKPKTSTALKIPSFNPIKNHAIPHVTMVQEPEVRLDGTYTSMIDSAINIGIYRGKYKEGKPFFILQREDDSLEITQEVTEVDEAQAQYIQRIR